MSYIDVLNKTIYITSTNYIGLTPEWIAALKRMGYKVEDIRIKK